MPTEAEIRKRAEELGLDPDHWTFVPNSPVVSTDAKAAPALSSSALGAAGRGFKRSVFPAAAGIGTAGALSLMLAPETFGMSLIPLGAGLLAGYGGGKLQEHVSPTTPEEAAQIRADVQQHGAATMLGELAPSLVAFKPSLGGIAKAFSRTGGDAAAKAAVNAARLNVGLGAGLGALQETALPTMRGEPIDWKRAAMSTAAGALLNKPNFIGQRIGFRDFEPRLSAEGPPAAMGGVGYDLPIGPDIPPTVKAVAGLVPPESSMTRLYRARYGQTELPTATTPLHEEGIGHVTIHGTGEETPATLPVGPERLTNHWADETVSPAPVTVDSLQRQVAGLRAQDMTGRTVADRVLRDQQLAEIEHQLRTAQTLGPEGRGAMETIQQQLAAKPIAALPAPPQRRFVTTPEGKTVDFNALSPTEQAQYMQTAAFRGTPVERPANATNPKPIEAGVQPEHQGIQSRTDLPPNQTQVREEAGQSAGSGRGLLGGAGTETAKPLTPAEQADVQAELAREQNVRYQQADALAKNTPAEALLAHPTNADMLAFTEQVALRHNVQLKATQEPILTGEGKAARGAANIGERIATYNRDLARVDTGLHEIAEVFLDDLRTSPHPAERSLRERGLSVFGGDNEKLVEAIGLRASELGKIRIEGNQLTRFKAWAKDFWSWVKNKWGSASADDLKNLMARRMVFGKAVERAPGLTPAEGIRYQTVEERRQAVRDARRLADTSNELQKNDFTVPLIRAVIERVRKLPLVGQTLAENFGRFYDVRNDMLGRYLNQSTVITKGLTGKERLSISTRFHNEQENPNAPAVVMTERANSAFVALKALFRSAAEEANARGIRIWDGDNFREIFINNRYFPHIVSDAAADILQRKRGTADYNRLRDSYVAWLEAGGKKGRSASMTHEQAVATWKEKFESSQPQTVPRSNGGFGPLEYAAGYGLPPEMREYNLDNVLSRYFERYAQKVAWFETVEKPTPENNIVRQSLGYADQFGSKEHNAATLPDGQAVPSISSDPAVSAMLTDMLRNYDRRERLVDAVNRIVKGLMLGPLTGQADVIGGIAKAAQHLGLSDYVLFLPKSVANIADGIKWGMRRNVIQANSARLQSNVEGGWQWQNYSKTADHLNTVADLIYKITGRDGLEKFGRGLLMNMGMLKTQAAAGRIVAGRGSKADVKWLDTFLGKGKWEAALNGAEGLTTDNMSLAAAHFVESVQGMYDARGQPAFALAGQFSPFLSLAKWNIETANNFTKYVINPLTRGDVAPLLKMTAFGLMGGEAIQAIRKMVTGRKSQEADWYEVAAAGGKGWEYRMLASLAYAGYAGSFADLTKQAFDIGHGNVPMGFTFPVVGAVTQMANRASQYVQAVENGENAIETLAPFIWTTAKDHIQVVRALARYKSEDEMGQVQRANAIRDLRVFRQQSGLPVPSRDASKANPFLAPLDKKFERSRDAKEIVGLAPQLTRQAFERGAGDPERIRSLLQSARTSGSDLMPSLTRQPREFAAYLQWVRQTQGDDAARQLVQNYQKKQGLDALRSSLIPRL